MIAYIGVGSNIGDRYGQIDTAQFFLEKKGVMIKRVSPLYETEAVCKPGERQPKFINGVFEVETDLSSEALLDLLEGIERNMGRFRKGDWTPRTIDLDILFYGDQVVDSPRLKIPHLEITKRWFVLKPLADLAPDLVHPVLKKKIKELLEEICNSSSIPPM
jgi:2-amino-4-hydroxy-6-hydroxymethyldihydropteridine diphosphokinase